MTDTQASKVATDEMLSMLPPDKRRQLLVDNDGERLSINIAGKNGEVDRNQGGLFMSLTGDDFRRDPMDRVHCKNAHSAVWFRGLRAELYHD